MDVIIFAKQLFRLEVQIVKKISADLKTILG